MCVIICTGTDCTERGCPGDPTQPELGSCTSRGICSLIDQLCTCNTWWKGDGCEVADCRGDPDCSGLGWLLVSKLLSCTSLRAWVFYLIPLNIKPSLVSL